MNAEDLKKLVKDIVEQANKLKNKHIDGDAPVNYVCIFAQSQKEYEEFLEAAQKLGKLLKETSMGPVFYIKPMDTVAGPLKMVKIRVPDPTRTERGDADFTISDYANFEKKHLTRSGFKKIERPNFVMIELMDSDFDVRVYFSNPSMEEYLREQKRLPVDY
jgi:hypothetical protein